MSNSQLADEQKKIVPFSLPPALLRVSHADGKSGRDKMTDSSAGALTDDDLAQVKATISEEMRRAAPKPASPWPVALSIIGATVAIIGTLGPLMIYAIGKDQETRVVMLESIKESVAGVKDSVSRNTDALSGLSSDINELKVTFVQLDGNFAKLDRNFEDLNDNFEGLIEQIKSGPE